MHGNLLVVQSRLAVSEKEVMFPGKTDHSPSSLSALINLFHSFCFLFVCFLFQEKNCLSFAFGDINPQSHHNDNVETLPMSLKCSSLLPGPTCNTNMM